MFHGLLMRGINHAEDPPRVWDQGGYSVTLEIVIVQSHHLKCLHYILDSWLGQWALRAPVSVNLAVLHPHP